MGRIGKLGNLSTASSKGKGKYTVSTVRIGGEKAIRQTTTSLKLIADQLVDGYDLELSSEEKKGIEDEEERKWRRSLGSKGRYGVQSLFEVHAADLQQLIGKYVHFIGGINKARMGYVSSISVAGQCNVLLLQPENEPRVHKTSSPYHLQEIVDFETLDGDEMALVDVHRSQKDKRLASSAEKKALKEARVKGKRASHGTEDREDEDLEDETATKSPKFLRKEASLVDKYVRIGSGAFTGRVGRAVSNTVGNIYSICVLDLSDEIAGKHTSVTASKLPIIKEEDCTEVELDAIRNDEILLKKRQEKRMRRAMRENKRAKRARGSGPSAGHESASDDDNQVPHCNLLEVPKDAIDKYIRIQTGQYTGLLARVSTIVKRYKCSVRILEAPGCSAFKGTTVTGANLVFADMETLSDAEKDMLEHDLKMREAAGINPSSGARKKAPKRVFEVDIEGQYVRLMNGLYGGKIGRVTKCPVGSSPCTVKVQCREILYRSVPVLLLSHALSACSTLALPYSPYPGDI
jgi:hypothetical protein